MSIRSSHVPPTPGVPAADPRPLSRALGIVRGQAVAAVGCGGKSSLLRGLMREWGAQRVLLSTCTKISFEEARRSDHLYTAPEQWLHPDEGVGIHAMGVPCAQGRKLSAPPLEHLEAVHSDFDLTLLECDGSRRLPLKGWRADEPVVPAFTDITVGVATLWPIGKPAGEDLIFQLPLFCRISGAQPGDCLTPEHLAAAIAHPQGLFHNARGRRVLLLNQAEDDDAMAAAFTLVRLLPSGCADRILAGSIHQSRLTELYRRDFNA